MFDKHVLLDILLQYEHTFAGKFIKMAIVCVIASLPTYCYFLIDAWTSSVVAKVLGILFLVPAQIVFLLFAFLYAKIMILDDRLL